MLLLQISLLAVAVAAALYFLVDEQSPFLLLLLLRPIIRNTLINTAALVIDRFPSLPVIPCVKHAQRPRELSFSTRDIVHRFSLICFDPLLFQSSGLEVDMPGVLLLLLPLLGSQKG